MDLGSDPVIVILRNEVTKELILFRKTAKRSFADAKP